MSLEFTNFYIDTFEKALLPAATFPLRCNITVALVTVKVNCILKKIKEV